MIPSPTPYRIEDDELSEKFVRASGPGGQHVNTSSTAVELRFDARNSPSLPEDVKHRLERIAGSRMNQDGVIVIFAQSHRSQEMNRPGRAGQAGGPDRTGQPTPKPRKKTRPTYASKTRSGWRASRSVRRREGDARAAAGRGLSPSRSSGAISPHGLYARLMADRVRLLAAAALLGSLTACAPSLRPAAARPPRRRRPPAKRPSAPATSRGRRRPGAARRPAC